jgi:hypothetical protein
MYTVEEFTQQSFNNRLRRLCKVNLATRLLGNGLDRAQQFARRPGHGGIPGNCVEFNAQPHRVGLTRSDDLQQSIQQQADPHLNEIAPAQERDLGFLAGPNRSLGMDYVGSRK